MQEKIQQEQETMKENRQGEAVFPDGPPQNAIENWKQEFGDIYMTEFDSDTFIWRALSRMEYKEIMNGEQLGEWESEEKVVSMCTLWPENYTSEDMTRGKAGIPSTLFDQIMAKSGFVAQGTARKL